MKILLAVDESNRNGFAWLYRDKAVASRQCRIFGRESCSMFGRDCQTEKEENTMMA